MKIRKRPFLCVDGPWCGHTLYLATPLTTVVHAGGRVGRYVYLYPSGHKDAKNLLIWEPVNGNA